MNLKVIVWTLIFFTTSPVTHSLITCSNEWVQRSFSCLITDKNTLVLYFEFKKFELQPVSALHSYFLEIKPEEMTDPNKSRDVRNCSREKSVSKNDKILIVCDAFSYGQSPTAYDQKQNRYRLQLLEVKSSNNINSNNNNNSSIKILKTESNYAPPWITYHCCTNYYKFVQLKASDEPRYDEITLIWHRRWFNLRQV